MFSNTPRTLKSFLRTDLCFLLFLELKPFILTGELSPGSDDLGQKQQPCPTEAPP